MVKTTQEKRKKKTESLKIATDSYRALVKQSADGVFIFQDGRFTLKNNRLEELLGSFNQKSFLEDPDWAFFIDRLEEHLRSAEERAAQTKGVQSFSFTICRQDKGGRDLEAVMTTIEYQGRPAVHGMVREITGEEKENLKSSSLTIAAHEIRTAITVINGYNKMLLRKQIGALNPAQHKILKESKLSCDRLRSIVNQILDHSRMEGKKIRMHFQKEDIGECVRNVHSEFRHLARSKKIALRKRIPRKDLVKAPLDKNKIEQVLINLTKNAIENTPEGGKVEIQVTPPTGNFVKACVADNGIGVPPEEREIIFDAFEMGKSSEGTEGMGLGLAICKKIIELHQGSIWVEPRKGGGSKFIFTLPLKRS